MKDKTAAGFIPQVDRLGVTESCVARAPFHLAQTSFGGKQLREALEPGQVGGELSKIRHVGFDRNGALTAEAEAQQSQRLRIGAYEPDELLTVHGWIVSGISGFQFGGFENIVETVWIWPRPMGRQGAGEQNELRKKSQGEDHHCDEQKLSCLTVHPVSSVSQSAGAAIKETVTANEREWTLILNGRKQRKGRRTTDEHRWTQI
jgi:hypothetical protein